jgi:hypothetical protein
MGMETIESTALVLVKPTVIDPKQWLKERDKEARELRKEYLANDKQITSRVSTIVRKIDGLIPHLLKQRELLSRKGDFRFMEARKQAQLPQWTPYLKGIAQQFEIGLRTLQRKLAEAAGEAVEPTPRPDRPKGTGTPTQWRHMIEIAEGLGEIAELKKAGRPVDDAVDALVKLAYSPTELENVVGANNDLRAGLLVEAEHEAKKNVETSIVHLISLVRTYIIGVNMIFERIPDEPHVKASRTWRAKSNKKWGRALAEIEIKCEDETHKQHLSNLAAVLDSVSSTNAA